MHRRWNPVTSRLMNIGIQQPITANSLNFWQAMNPILQLGWPMILTQLFIMGTGFLDTAMAGNYSSVDLAGVALGNNLLWPIFMLLTGITMALTPITSQLNGAGRLKETGFQIQQGLWLCLGSSALMVIILMNVTVIYEISGVQPEIASIASDYLFAAAWGMPPVILYVALRHACEGLGQTRAPMIIAGSVLPINAVLNYALIYGEFGLPEMGGVGCGWATAIVFWIEFMLMLCVIRFPFFKATGFFERLSLPDAQAAMNILKLGVPIGLLIFIEMAAYAIVTFLIARIGIVDMAAHSIAGNLNWLTYVIPMSIGAAASIRIGFLVGADRLSDARSTASAAFKFALVYALVVSLVLVAFRYQLVGVYTDDQDVLAVAGTLMLFIAVYQIIDDSQAVAGGALRGYKDTTVPMVFGLVGYWFLALPVGYGLANGHLGFPALGVYGYWAGISIGMGLVAPCLAFRLWHLSGRRDKIKQLAAQRSEQALG